MALDDLPGMPHRTNQAEAHDITPFYAPDPRHARMIWCPVEGERFVRLLQEEGIPLLATKRSGYDNSKVLAPEYRAPDKTYLVGRWLVEKAAARLRRDNRTTQQRSACLRCCSTP